MTRLFTHRLATRDKTPLLVGIVGPSSSGKTYSALRLATGYQRVQPGEIFVVDTEAGRAVQYADKFRFMHVPFGAPFSPDDYVEVLKHCVDKGAAHIIIDSLSHEHEGPGGVLEWHAREMGGNYSRQFLAWAKPKAARRKLINWIMQQSCNFIFCSRAKQKLKMPPKGSKDEPTELGYQPIGGDEWIYEMTLNMLMLPRANGVPTWHSEQLGEAALIKLPEHFREIFVSKPQLSEAVGEALARWAAGTSATPKMTSVEMCKEYASCSEASELRRLKEVRGVSWSSFSEAERAAVKSAAEQCMKRIEEATAPPPPPEPDDGDVANPADQAAAAS